MLFIIRHRGTLEIECAPIATHQERLPHGWEQQHASLVELDEQMAWKLISLENVVSVEVPRPGRFTDDRDGAVVVCPNGTWVDEDDLGAGD